MKLNPELTGMIVRGFRVVSATDMESVNSAVLMARATGSVGATHTVTEVAGPEVMDRAIDRFAEVTAE